MKWTATSTSNIENKIISIQYMNGEGWKVDGIDRGVMCYIKGQYKVYYDIEKSCIYEITKKESGVISVIFNGAIETENDFDTVLRLLLIKKNIL
jgi:hypothetical protein